MHFLKFIFAVQIPQNQIDQLVFHLHLFLVNFDADSGVVFVGKDAAHEARHQTGFAYRERTEHADFFLDHGLIARGI